MNDWMAGFEAVFSLGPLLMIVAGATVGIVVGALPGLTATMTVAVLLPFTFAMEPVSGMMLLLGVYGGALYAGSIPAILIRTPGTPSAAATLLDGYPMAQQGRAGEALALSLWASVIGGLIGVTLLGLLTPQLARITLLFGTAEFFLIAVFALTIIASVSDTSMVKGLISGLIGILIALVGLDPVQGLPRFTFGSTALSGGLSLIPVLIGLFGVSEALHKYEQVARGTVVRSTRVTKIRLPRESRRDGYATTWWSSMIGFFVGLLPGVGGDIGSFVAYNETKRFSKGARRFGKGDPRGVVAAEAANNASTGGALAPLLTLGIPGDAVGAVLIGAITVHGLRPGTQLFESSPSLVYGIFIGFFIAYICVLLVGWFGIRLWVHLLSVPTTLLWPAVLALCVIGSFALRNSSFDVLVMIGAGLLGYFMIKGRYPLAPLVIGMILGPMMESNLRRTMILHRGSFEWFLDPGSLVIIGLTILAITVTVRGRKQAVVPGAKEAPGSEGR